MGTEQWELVPWLPRGPSPWPTLQLPVGLVLHGSAGPMAGCRHRPKGPRPHSGLHSQLFCRFIKLPPLGSRQSLAVCHRLLLHTRNAPAVGPGLRRESALLHPKPPKALPHPDQGHEGNTQAVS